MEAERETNSAARVCSTDQFRMRQGAAYTKSDGHAYTSSHAYALSISREMVIYLLSAGGQGDRERQGIGWESKSESDGWNTNSISLPCRRAAPASLAGQKLGNWTVQFLLSPTKLLFHSQFSIHNPRPPSPLSWQYMHTSYMCIHSA